MKHFRFIDVKSINLVLYIKLIGLPSNQNSDVTRQKILSFDIETVQVPIK